MFVITQQAMAELEKGRKRRERERLGQVDDAVSGAHAAAEGYRAVMLEDQERRDGAEKAYDGRGPIEGPSHPMRPGDVDPGDYTRGYIEAGHAAPSPQHGTPVPHIDLTGSQARGVLIPACVQASMGPVGGDR
jgi:hypothetical protein